MPQLDKLRTNTEALGLMMDTLPVHLWYLVDIETYGRVNKTHADFCGIPKEDFEFRKIKDVHGEEFGAQCIRYNQLVIDARAPVYTEETVPGCSGEMRLMGITKTPKFGPDGKTLEYILCFGQDITERRKIKLRLAQDEENFRTFLDTIDDVVLIMDPDGRIVYASASAIAKTSYSRDELLRMHLLDLIPEWSHAEARNLYLDILAGSPMRTCRIPIKRKDGSLLPCETHAWNGKWNGNSCVFGSSRDLSAEQELQRRFESFFRYNPAIMSIVDHEDKTFVDVNNAFQEILGYTAGEVVGKTTPQVGLNTDLMIRDSIDQTIDAKGGISNLEIQLTAKGGNTFNGLMSCVVIETLHRKLILTTIIDITARKKAEAEREKTIAELKLAMDQIKTLKGFIPICSCCKKIRDDKGYWEQVEAYITKHSDAQFTHGICPECRRKFYPDAPERT